MARDMRILLLLAASLLARPVIVDEEAGREDALDRILAPRDNLMRITLPADRMMRDDIVLRDHFFAAHTPEYPRVPQTLASQYAMRRPQLRGSRPYRR